jgi:hypothetical protein
MRTILLLLYENFKTEVIFSAQMFNLRHVARLMTHDITIAIGSFMKIEKPFFVVAILFSIIATKASALGYVPVTIAETQVSPKVVVEKGYLKNLVVKRQSNLQAVVDVRGLKGDNKAATFSECVTPPTVEEIGGSFEMNRYVMTRNAAGKLGIVGGMGNIDGSAEQLLAVFDFSRSKECLAADGKTRLVYGQAIRTVMSFASADTKVAVSFPVVAASATIAGKSSTINVKNIGFNDSGMALKAVAMSSLSLDVGSYTEFTRLHKELIDLAAADTTPKKVELLGIIPAVDEDELKNTLVSAYAIQSVKNSTSCTVAQNKFRNPEDKDALRVVDATYVYISGACSAAAPTSVASAKAKDYLRGMSVRNW